MADMQQILNPDGSLNWQALTQLLSTAGQAAQGQQGGGEPTLQMDWSQIQALFQWLAQQAQQGQQGQQGQPSTPPAGQPAPNGAPTQQSQYRQGLHYNPQAASANGGRGTPNFGMIAAPTTGLPPGFNGGGGTPNFGVPAAPTAGLPPGFSGGGGGGGTPDYNRGGNINTSGNTTGGLPDMASQYGTAGGGQPTYGGSLAPPQMGASYGRGEWGGQPPMGASYGNPSGGGTPDYNAPPQMGNSYGTAGGSPPPTGDYASGLYVGAPPNYNTGTTAPWTWQEPPTDFQPA